MKKLSVILFIFLAGCAPVKPTSTVTPDPTPSSPLPTPTQTVVPTLAPTVTEQSPAGLSVSQTEAASGFQLLKFTFALKVDAFGNEVDIGTLPDKFAEIQLFGPPADLNQAVLVIWERQPPSQTQSTRMMTYLGKMLAVFAGDWNEGSDWLNSSLTKIGETKTQFGEDEAILDLTPSKQLMTIEFTIRVTKRK